MSKIYPTWRYHKNEEPKIIKSEQEEHPDWKDSPAHFEKDEPSDEPSSAGDEILEDLKIKPKKKK